MVVMVWAVMPASSYNSRRAAAAGVSLASTVPLITDGRPKDGQTRVFRTCLGGCATPRDRLCLSRGFARLMSWLERGHPGAGKRIGGFIFGVTGMAFDPFPDYAVAGLRLIQLLP